MKKFLLMMLVCFLGLGLWGCSLGSASTDDIADFVSGVDPQEAVTLATNLLAVPAIQDLANAIMADSNLVATLTSAWANVEGDYVTPDEVVPEPGGTPDSGAVSSALPKIGAGKTITGWAPVNYWWNMDDATIRDNLAYMQARNVRWFGPETVGNAGEDMLGNAAKLDRMKSRWLLTQAECRARGIWFAPILFNDNAGDGAYSNGGVKLEKRMAQAKALIDWVAANGDKSVLSITIVSEIQTSAGKQLEAYGLAVLGKAGFRLDYNGSGHPSSKPSGYSGLISYHVCDVSKWPAAALIWLNDCGTSIRESIRALNVNGDLNGLGDPAKIAAKKAEAVARGQYVFSVYGFQVKTFDKAAIDALAMPGESSTGSDTAVMEAVNGSILPSQVKWLGDNYANAKTTVALTNVSMSGTHLIFKSSAISWPPQGAKKCKAVGFLIRKIGSQYVGGKVEWCVVERGWYDIVTNTKKLTRQIQRSGYNGATMPASGETCWAGLGHPTGGSECSTLVPFVWK